MEFENLKNETINIDFVILLGQNVDRGHVTRRVHIHFR